MRARVEPFGAWVQLDEPPVLVALDRAASRRAGIDGGARWAEDPPRPSAPLEVHVAVTARCGAGCQGCYLDARPEGEVPSFDVIAERLRALAAAGVFTVAFGGGEPLSRPDLGALGALARELGLRVVTTTSGIGMTEARARELRAFDQISVSYDGVGDDYEAVRGYDGARTAERAMRLLAAAGVRFGVNVVLTRATFDGVWDAVLRARSLGAVEAQLLRYKPRGRAASLGYLATRLSQAQVRAVPSLLERLVAGAGMPIRIDCAMVPFLSGHAEPDALVRWGVLGCEAGRTLAAATVSGELSPCSFTEPSGVPVDEVSGAWPTSPSASAHREHAARAPEPCASCPVRASCRGGCRVVATHAGDPWGPDPECPRVVDHQRQQRTSVARAPA